jgi:hypothetical protein
MPYLYPGYHRTNLYLHGFTQQRHVTAFWRGGCVPIHSHRSTEASETVTARQHSDIQILANYSVTSVMLLVGYLD